MWHVLQSFAYASYGSLWLQVSRLTFFFWEGFGGSAACSHFSARRDKKRKNKDFYLQPSCHCCTVLREDMNSASELRTRAGIRLLRFGLCIDQRHRAHRLQSTKCNGITKIQIMPMFHLNTVYNRLLAWASDAASSSVFCFFFRFFLDLSPPPEGSSASFSSSDTCRDKADTFWQRWCTW